MHPPPPAILNLTDPSLLAPLAADARADGRRMVGRLIDEWSQGINRFDRPGERAYVAVQGAREAILRLAAGHDKSVMDLAAAAVGRLDRNISSESIKANEPGKEEK